MCSTSTYIALACVSVSHTCTRFLFSLFHFSRLLDPLLLSFAQDVADHCSVLALPTCGPGMVRASAECRRACITPQTSNPPPRTCVHNSSPASSSSLTNKQSNNGSENARPKQYDITWKTESHSYRSHARLRLPPHSFLDIAARIADVPA